MTDGERIVRDQVEVSAKRFAGALALLPACGAGAGKRASEVQAPHEIVLGESSPEEERKIVAAVDASNAIDIALWQRVVEINSGTTNLEGVRQVGAIFRALDLPADASASLIGLAPLTILT